MKISARNALKGKVVDIKKGSTTAHVQIDVNGSIIVERGCVHTKVAVAETLKGGFLASSNI